MSERIVLDAAAFDVLDVAAGRGLWAVLERAAERGVDTYCAAVTLAEVCRGSARTQRVESVVARSRGGRQVRVIPTDQRLAKQVGAILNATQSGSEMLADAHVVAVAAGSGSSLVITSDPDDITRLAVAVPGVRIVTRAP